MGVGDEDTEGLSPSRRDAVGDGVICGVLNALPDAGTVPEEERDGDNEGVTVLDSVAEGVAIDVLVFVDVGDWEAVLDLVDEDVLITLGDFEGLEPTDKVAEGVTERDREGVALAVAD